MYKEKTQIMDGASHFNTDSPPPFCATFAEVEVDSQTGKVRVLHMATAVDPGTAINPAQAEGQVEGAVAQGLGYALTEELVLDSDGRPMNPNFLDYKIFGAKDMPKLTTILVETDEPLGPYGAKSISEVPINGPAPASPTPSSTPLECVSTNCRSAPRMCCAPCARKRRLPMIEEPSSAGTRAQCHILFGLPDTIHELWAGLHPARRFSTGAGRPVYKQSGRVTNPPQVSNLPHSSCRIPGSGKSMWHWALVPAASRLIGTLFVARPASVPMSRDAAD